MNKSKDKIELKALIDGNVVRINDKEIPLTINISQRAKRMLLKVTPTKNLQVILPQILPMKKVESFISYYCDWILKHINKPVKQSPRFLLFEKEIKIFQEYNLFIKKHHIKLFGDILKITSPQNTKDSKEFLYEAWLKHYSKSFLIKRTTELAEQNNFSFQKISIRGQSSRWGSCSRKGNISLNYKLLKLRKELIDYVIIHELCHLIQLNHSAKFWREIELIIPNYKELKKELRSYSNF